MSDHGKAMVFAAFVADSLALGAHWIYDTEQIRKRFGRVDRLLKPGSGSFHATKEKGDFTHYGDQALVLLESIAEKGTFDLEDFSSRWRALFDGYTGYMDEATRLTLSSYASGKGAKEAGSPSNDLAGAARAFPLVYRFYKEPDTMVEAAKAQTRMTHGDPLTVDSAEFFAGVLYRVLDGASPVKALEEISQQDYPNTPLMGWVEKGLQSKEGESVAAIARFGQTCHTPDALPGVVHLIAKYERDLREALVQSVMAGGDSAARGMAVGMVLGAYLGMGSLPEEWLSDLNKGEYIADLLEKIAL